jgi:hypothetical protein
MSFIKTGPVKNSTIMLVYSERENIKLDPPYQRMGGVWTLEKKQLLIDSILNDYDIPKIYFHTLTAGNEPVSGHEYTVIDGRQRLETIWDFIDGGFYLSKDFEYQRDPSINLSGLSYDDISQKYPRIKIQFDSFILPVVGVETDDDDLIEDMFSRLNEAVPLNAAEKRNAIGGDLVRSIREISEHDFFKKKVCFTNKRYQHREVVARMLLVEDCMQNQGKLIDTKKVYLDSLARRYSQDHKNIVGQLQNEIYLVLDHMMEVFGDSDPLLRAQGNMVVYYLLFKKAYELDSLNSLDRRSFLDFNEELRSNRLKAEESYEDSSFDLLEYDRLTQQGTNDASNIKERVSVLGRWMGLGEIEI